MNHRLIIKNINRYFERAQIKNPNTGALVVFRRRNMAYELGRLFLFATATRVFKLLRLLNQTEEHDLSCFADLFELLRVIKRLIPKQSGYMTIQKTDSIVEGLPLGKTLYNCLDNSIAVIKTDEYIGLYTLMGKSLPAESVYDYLDAAKQVSVDGFFSITLRVESLACLTRGRSLLPVPLSQDLYSLPHQAQVGLINMVNFPSTVTSESIVTSMQLCLERQDNQLAEAIFYLYYSKYGIYTAMQCVFYWGYTDALNFIFLMCRDQIKHFDYEEMFSYLSDSSEKLVIENNQLCLQRFVIFLGASRHAFIDYLNRVSLSETKQKYAHWLLSDGMVFDWSENDIWGNVDTHYSIPVLAGCIRKKRQIEIEHSFYITPIYYIVVKLKQAELVRLIIEYYDIKHVVLHTYGVLNRLHQGHQFRWGRYPAFAPKTIIEATVDFIRAAASYLSAPLRQALYQSLCQFEEANDFLLNRTREWDIITGALDGYAYYQPQRRSVNEPEGLHSLF
tara:strand:+ start:143092 stop:144606 length:1515 start_codon:yes stop_codon:yes gene_type:complete